MISGSRSSFPERRSSSASAASSRHSRSFSTINRTRWSTNRLSSSMASTRWMISGRSFFGSNTVEFMPVICRRLAGKASHLWDRGKRAAVPAGLMQRRTCVPNVETLGYCRQVPPGQVRKGCFGWMGNPKAGATLGGRGLHADGPTPPARRGLLTSCLAWPAGDCGAGFRHAAPPATRAPLSPPASLPSSFRR